MDREEYFQQKEDALSSMVEDVLREFDEGNKGYLTKEEAKHWVCRAIYGADDLPGQMEEEIYDEVFGSIDTDGSGALERDEILHHIKLMTSSFL